MLSVRFLLVARHSKTKKSSSPAPVDWDLLGHRKRLMDLGVSGLALGFDRLSPADRLIEIERALQHSFLVEPFEMEKQTTSDSSLQMWPAVSQYPAGTLFSEEHCSKGSTIIDSDGDDDVVGASASNGGAIAKFTQKETAQSNINRQRARSK